MRALRWLALVAVVLAALSLGASAAAADSGRNFVAHLSSGNEVPPRDTGAQGEAIFHLSPDRSTLHYKLIVANIDNVAVSHIHLAPAGMNGGVVVFLYPGPSRPGRTDGVLAEGDITSADLINALAGHPLRDLLTAMDSGGAYVNVHTTAFPGGEIRGQIH